MTRKPSPFDLQKCARPNILALQPYRCARDDYKDDGRNILLDANENAYGPGLAAADSGGGGGAQGDIGVLLKGLNRYPDPNQLELKQQLCRLRNTGTHTEEHPLSPENVFVGVGSDEAIDALFRCFCTPGVDKILTCPPTYGMYAVCAQVNDVRVVEVALDTANGFALRPDAINEVLSRDPTIKLVYFSSPGNPTGNLVGKSALREVLGHPSWNGVVVLDEAYVDFASDGSSLAGWVTEWPNLVVMQTLSKAFGLAGIRLGVAFTSPPITKLLNNLKAPYNISSLASALAISALSPKSLEVMRANRAQILTQRDRMLAGLPKIGGIGRFMGGQDANFLLVEILDKPGGKPCNRVALALYKGLAEKKGVVVRFRGKELGCEGCLRITVGTEDEVGRLLVEVKQTLSEIYSEQKGLSSCEGSAKEANDIIA
ncbi:MAG: histidinol-phosphate transaminase [Geoglossum simile]|nr:MAG: histidinol-phosphate transaminase [Geoglossum simile]